MVSIHHIFGRTLSLSRKTERHPFWRSQTDCSNYSPWKIAFWWEGMSTFYENVFNGARRLTCQTLWLWFLFHYEKVSMLYETNVQSGYNDLFSSWFYQSSFPFSQSELDLKEFIVGVIIPALLPFCVNEFIDFGFQVSIWNPEFVRGSDLRPIWLPSLLFHFLSLQYGLGFSI